MQNIELWRKFKLELKKGLTTHSLWHGTRGCDPEMVCKKGLNINYSNVGMWGKGIYFAVNANYSCPNYSHIVPNAHQTYEVFLADVVTGEYIDTKTSNDPNLREPPMIPGEKKHYDAVKGHTNGSDVFIVYKNESTYPGLLVRYSI